MNIQKVMVLSMIGNLLSRMSASITYTKDKNNNNFTGGELIRESVHRYITSVINQRG